MKCFVYYKTVVKPRRQIPESLALDPILLSTFDKPLLGHMLDTLCASQPDPLPNEEFILSLLW